MELQNRPDALLTLSLKLCETLMDQSSVLKLQLWQVGMFKFTNKTICKSVHLLFPLLLLVFSYTLFHSFKLHVVQVDVKTAFLIGIMEEAIWVASPRDVSRKPL